MLLDEIAKMKAELAELDKEEDVEAKEVEEVKEDKEPVEEKEKAPPEEELQTKEAPIIPEKKEEPLDNGGYARLRREAAAEKRRADELERKLAEVQKVREIPEAEVKEEIVLPPVIQSIVERHNIDSAEREFLAFESKAKQDHPEYGAVAAEYSAAMYQAIRVRNPRKSEVELNEMTKREILFKAAEFARAGYENPVEEMYHEARELGYTGKSFQKQEKASRIKEEPKLEPDLNKVAENRKRSTGMAANNGRAEGTMSMAAAADLTAAEWAKLPKAEKQRLLHGR